MQQDTPIKKVLIRYLRALITHEAYQKYVISTDFGPDQAIFMLNSQRAASDLEQLIKIQNICTLSKIIFKNNPQNHMYKDERRPFRRVRYT